MKNLIITVLLFCCFNHLHAQVVKVTPSKPSIKDTIRLTYNCADTAALLKNAEPIYARVTVTLQDGGHEKFHVTMQGKENIQFNKFILPAKAASFKVEFYTLNKDDNRAGQSLLVYNDDHNKPVNGAFLSDMFDDKPDPIFNNELKNYPHNYLAYATFMNIAAMIKDQQTARPQIIQLLKKLDSIENTGDKTDRKGMLAAFCVGYAKTGNLQEGKKYLYKLFDQFPQAPETAFAFSIYNYEYYKASRKNVEDDVRIKIEDIFMKYPGASISSDGNVIQFLKDDESIPLSAFEKALLPLYANDRLQYYQLSSLPEVYTERHAKFDSAKKILLSAINRFQDGTINHQFRLSNSHYQLYVPVMYLDLARINMLQKDYQSAITYISAANNIISGSNSEGNFLPLMLAVRAKAFHQSGNLNLAFDDYKTLYKMGNATALDSMRRLFPLCSLKQKTFDEFVATLKKPANNAAVVHANLAPDITATDLKGKKVHLSDFKGKLVILNIWGIGCGPCIAEMPELNQLVNQYVNNPNVVFLAIAGDKTQSLVRFLKIHKFNYKVLNNAGNLTEKLNTNSLPVHMVIGKQGEIISRSIGARDDIKSYLQQIIAANI